MEKNKKMMIVIIALLIVLLGVIVSVSVFAFRLINSDKTVDVGELSDVSIFDSETMDLESALNCNLLKGADGAEHYISLSVSIAIDVSNQKEDAKLIEKIMGSEAIIRDAVNAVVSDKTLEEVSGTANREKLKEEILEKLQDEFQTNIIYKVFFSNIYTV